MKLFSKRVWVTGLVVFIAVIGLAIFQVLRTAELRRLKDSRSNLLQLGMEITLYAIHTGNEKGGLYADKYPALSTEPGILQMDAETGVQMVQETSEGVTIFISPAHPQSQAFLLRAEVNPASVVNDESYWYLGYALPDEERGMAFVEWYRERAGQGAIPSPSVIEQGNVRLRRMIHEVDVDILYRDPQSGEIKAETLDRFITEPLSSIPVMIERPGLFKGGGHVLFADGKVQFLDYPGEYPMTREFIEALESLGELAH